MRSTLPDFATVLKEMATDIDLPNVTPPARVAFASALFSANLGGRPTVSRQPDVLQTLFDVEGPPEAAAAPEQERQAIIARMERQSPDAIRSELDLRPGLKRAELQRRRRSFAVSNHPDRLPEEFRQAAEQRMKTANALLDTAMANAPA